MIKKRLKFSSLFVVILFIAAVVSIPLATVAAEDRAKALDPCWWPGGCDNEEEETTTTLIYGVISDRTTGNPIDNAIVNAVSDGTVSHETETDERGNYWLNDLRSGKWKLTVTAEGYSSQTYTFNLSGQEVVVNLALKPERSLPADLSESAEDTETIVHGVVTKKNGKPIKKAKVKLKGTDKKTTKTDASGYYEFRDIEDGEWKLVVKAEGYKKATIFINISGGVYEEDFVLKKKKK
ncbi:carboxypeptidase-like regulatory domain-containing protein [Desulfonema magnum]|uniref:Carboxypeptidase regulatory-like domain-containing protein n=1 Tax=Desulfonema magnum TaxID=45655 RepID=A0A975GSS7_9BACT|nr:carboxypeptidase-like regulatory domain-containing protein [Desulfonema magnum]QTA92370.1 Carboxypeptidase regulatory-like domain-containing protein [Desulfonema magnum]